MITKITPSREECMVLYAKYGTPDHVIRHCNAVANTAVRIGQAMNQNGYHLNLQLLESAALLHDIVRTEEDHGAKGAEILESLGYQEVAKLIRPHMSYESDPTTVWLTELDILCLADRLVIEDQYVGLEKRIQYILKKTNKSPEIEEKIRQKLDKNKQIKNRIEQLIKQSIDDLLI